MSKKEIIEEIEKLEDHIFYLEMADFLDWKKYHEYKDKVNHLKKLLEEC